MVHFARLQHLLQRCAEVPFLQADVICVEVDAHIGRVHFFHHAQHLPGSIGNAGAVAIQRLNREYHAVMFRTAGQFPQPIDSQHPLPFLLVG